MAIGADAGDLALERVAQLYEALRPHLDERQRRLLLGAEAARLGRGGVKAVAGVTGAHPATVARGAREASGVPEPRTRAPGGGRKKLADTDPGLAPALMALVEPESRGDPESPLRWTCLSTRNLAGTLTAAGHRCSAPTAARLLRAEGYSLQGNAKVAEGRQHPDRDAQFRYIARRAREHLDAGEPVVSVDAKKKEKAGNFANGGAAWRPQGRPERVNVHDFPSDAIGKAIPYGIYDLGANTGWVSVGTDHDTSAFAAATLRRWWRADGSARYPGARRLLICADAGGSNAARARAWKVELARLAAETGLQVTCCHYPPGTSKWNKVEHRLFAQITRNWRGRPLTSHQAVVELISATTTSTGLTVTAELDTSEYATGLAYTKKQVDALPIDYHAFHGNWNYTVRPEPHETPIPARKQTTRRRRSKLFIFDCLAVGTAAFAAVCVGAWRVCNGNPGGLEAFEDEPHRHRAFPDRGRGPLDRPAADVADGEDPGPAGFQEQGHPAGVVEPGFRDVGAGEQEPAGVFGELARQPPGAGLGADENEQAPDGQRRCLLPAGIDELHAF